MQVCTKSKLSDKYATQQSMDAWLGNSSPYRVAVGLGIMLKHIWSGENTVFGHSMILIGDVGALVKMLIVYYTHIMNSSKLAESK